MESAGKEVGGVSWEGGGWSQLGRRWVGGVSWVGGGWVESAGKEMGGGGWKWRRRRRRRWVVVSCWVVESLLELASWWDWWDWWVHGGAIAEMETEAEAEGGSGVGSLAHRHPALYLQRRPTSRLNV